MNLLARSLCWLAPFAGPGELLTDSLHGFRIELPDGWTRTEQDGGAKGFVLRLAPRDAIGERGVNVTVLELEDGQTLADLVALTRATIRAGGEAYGDYQEGEAELAGEVVPAIRVRAEAAGGPYSLSIRFARSEANAYLVQRHLPLDEVEERSRELEDVIRTFALAAVSAEALETAQGQRDLEALAARCGSEVAWAADWAEARARAWEEDKLVLAVANIYPGFSLASNPRTELFTDRDIVELTNERFVPLAITAGMEGPLAESYGLSPTTFGKGLLVFTPDAELILETQVAGEPGLAYPFLCEALARAPEARGAPPASDVQGLRLARLRVARGELSLAWSALEGDESAAAHLLRARIRRLERRGEEALAALQAAREAGARELELLAPEASLLIRAERNEEASAALERLLALGQAPDADPELALDARAEALLGLGMLDLQAGESERAQGRLREVIAQQPESRWAWIAAAGLQSEVFSVDVRPSLAWEDPAAVRELLTFPDPVPFATGTPGAVDDAAEGALTWLLAAQRPDGSWLVPSSVSELEGSGPDPFVDAITAIAGRALLAYPGRAETRAAATRALDFAIASVRRRETEPPLVLYMDYMTWSDSMLLAFLADALTADLAESEALRPTVEALLDDLGQRQQSGGGWSYYVTGDLGGGGAPTQSISFTTAAGILGLVRAREAGFTVAEELLGPAVEALSAMRDDDGVFAYFLYHATGQALSGGAPPGAVGRGPACELALMRAGASDADRLRNAVDRFLAEAPLYEAEQGKVLMHAGPDGQGCHYLFFDATHAALALAQIGVDPGQRVRILEMIARCRQRDGSFVDTPLIGRAYGTAMALLAFVALGS